MKESEGMKSKQSLGSSQANLFGKKKENLEDKARIVELIQNLENNNLGVLQHKLEIRSLKDQVIKLLEERHYNQAMAQLGGQIDMDGINPSELAGIGNPPGGKMPISQEGMSHDEITGSLNAGALEANQSQRRVVDMEEHLQLEMDDE